MYQIFAIVLWLLVGWKLDLEVEGQTNLPEKGPALIIFNHCDFLDVAAIMFSLPRKLTAFVASDHRKNPVVMLFRLAGSVILIKRGQTDKNAMKKGLKVLDSGCFLVVSPEGTRGSSDELCEGKFGPAYLAGMTGSKIIAVGIQGTLGGYKKLLKKFLTREKISIGVKIGRPFYLKINNDLVTKKLSEPGVKDQWQSVTNSQIMPEIARLLPRDMRGNF